jgi:hypothetical protein
MYKTDTVHYFSGWGISLCWWANIKYPEMILDQLIDLLFSKSGLGLTIVRYNLGGGSDPNLEQNFRLGANLPCIMNKDGKFNLENDRLQLDILDKSVKAGVDKVEIFCNSPPYFMTKSGYSNGSDKSWDCNLRPECIDLFADFLNNSYKLLIQKFPIVSTSPFNEPSNPFWTTSISQEGCYYDYETRRKIIKSLKSKKEDIKISSADESSSLFALLWYIFSPKNLISRINVHGYNYVEWRSLKFRFFDWTIWRRILRYFYKGELWMSEYGFGYDNTISSSLGLARNIFRDLDTLRPDAWIYWQVEHITSSWGLLKVDFRNPDKIYIQKQYWVFKHFTNTLRPGDTYKSVSKNILQINMNKYIILNDSNNLLSLPELSLCEKSRIYMSSDNIDYTEICSLPKVILPNTLISINF